MKRRAILAAIGASIALGCGSPASSSSGSPVSGNTDPGAMNAAGTAAAAAGMSAIPDGMANAGAAGGATPSTGTAGSGGSAGSAQPGGGAAGNDGPSDMPSTEVVITVIATTALNRPTDLEWNPYVDDELWVMNFGDSSAAIVTNASSEGRSVQRRLDPEAARHFMPTPVAFAFGARETSIVDGAGAMVEGTFATCPENNQSFMGPTLWTSDLRIFAITKAEREPPFNGPNTGGEGPGSHLDMLHRTPNCTGIAWEGAGNVYWTYSGTQRMFVKYDFALDHGIGNTDHSDGSVWRYPVTGIGYEPTVPSHLAFDPQSGLLYMADTGNGRVVTFDPASATQSSAMSALENVDGLREALDVSGGELQELVASSYGLEKPTGLELHEQTLYISDNETSTIHKFSLDGAPLGKVSIADVKRGGLAGLAFGPDGKLYFVDMIDERVLRLDSDF
jgi:hypothetical protein